MLLFRVTRILYIFFSFQNRNQNTNDGAQSFSKALSTQSITSSKLLVSNISNIVYTPPSLHPNHLSFCLLDGVAVWIMQEHDIIWLVLNITASVNIFLNCNQFALSVLWIWNKSKKYVLLSTGIFSKWKCFVCCLLTPIYLC